jgi:hypothetical protein
MKDFVFGLLVILAISAVIFWADIGKSIDQDNGDYKKYHVNAVKSVIK